MDRVALLTFSLFLTLLVKLPIIAFFFKQKKRQSALTIAFLIILITWIIGTLLWLKDPDINQFYVRIAATIVEGVAYWFFLGRNWKKALLLTIVTNTALYFVAEYVTLPDSFFQKKDNIIR